MSSRVDHRDLDRAAGVATRRRHGVREALRVGAGVACALLAGFAAGCGAPAAQSVPPAEAAATSPGASGHAATPHGDHSPHHGGTVLMFGDLHYEIVLPPDGGAALHLTDDVRRDLPASVVSHVVIELARPGHEADVLELAPDPSGAFWTAAGPAVTDPATVVRVGFAYDDQTVSVELPFASYFTRVGER